MKSKRRRKYYNFFVFVFFFNFKVSGTQPILIGLSSPKSNLLIKRLGLWTTKLIYKWLTKIARNSNHYITAFNYLCSDPINLARSPWTMYIYIYVCVCVWLSSCKYKQEEKKSLNNLYSPNHVKLPTTRNGCCRRARYRDNWRRHLRPYHGPRTSQVLIPFSFCLTKTNWSSLKCYICTFSDGKERRIRRWTFRYWEQFLEVMKSWSSCCYLGKCNMYAGRA